MLYTVLKIIHLFSVIIFLGNVITGLFWMQWAVRSRELKIIHHTIKGIIRSDIIFTLPAASVLTVTGLLMAAERQLPVFHISWILYSIVLFIISALIYALKVVPLQIELQKITGEYGSAKRFEWSNFRKLYRAWDVWGIISVITPLGAFVLMLLKVQL